MILRNFKKHENYKYTRKSSHDWNVSLKSSLFSAENVLQVLPIAHEYHSSLVTDCEDFMIAMCKPDKGLTVNVLLDYILVGEKYDLARFLEAAVEFCARIDFDLLNGKMFNSSVLYSSGFRVDEDKDIYSKFSNIGLNTQYAISKKRLQRMEMNRRKSGTLGDDYTIALSWLEKNFINEIMIKRFNQIRKTLVYILIKKTNCATYACDQKSHFGKQLPIVKFREGR